MNHRQLRHALLAALFSMGLAVTASAQTGSSAGAQGGGNAGSSASSGNAAGTGASAGNASGIGASAGNSAGAGDSGKTFEERRSLANRYDSSASTRDIESANSGRDRAGSPSAMNSGSTDRSGNATSASAQSSMPGSSSSSTQATSSDLSSYGSTGSKASSDANSAVNPNNAESRPTQGAGSMASESTPQQRIPASRDGSQDRSSTSSSATADDRAYTSALRQCVEEHPMGQRDSCLQQVLQRFGRA